MRSAAMLVERILDLEGEGGGDALVATAEGGSISAVRPSKLSANPERKCATARTPQHSRLVR